MIFGKSDEEKRQKEQRRVMTLKNGIRRLAWLPVKLANGRRVWLQRYWRFYHTGLSLGKYFIFLVGNTPYESFDARENYDESYIVPTKEFQSIQLGGLAFLKDGE